MNNIFGKILYIASLVIIVFSWSLLDAFVADIDGAYNSAILHHPENLSANIVLREIPTKLLRADFPFTVAWTPSTQTNARLYYSGAPRGGIHVEQNYFMSDVGSTAGSVNGIPVRRIEASAIRHGLGVGVWYCVIHDPGSGDTSMEFQVIIIPTTGVTTTSPVTGSTITDNQTPIFSWNSITGVPYYHITLSDQAFTIEYDTAGKMSVSGLNAIWMAITPSLSIQYGSADPSGHFVNQSPPPLIHGRTYNWMVMTNFGNDPLYSSDAAVRVASFTYHSSQQITPPALSHPINNVSISSPSITFRWDTISNPLTYHIFLSEERVESGSTVLYPVWNQITTNNSIELNARNILINSHYVWKVVATNENGVSTMSADGRFHYDIAVGTINLTIRDPQNNPVAFATVKAFPIDASMDDIPFTVNDEGNVKKKLPLGHYNLHISKSGFESVIQSVIIHENIYHNDEGNTSQHSFYDVVLPFTTARFVGSVKHNANILNNVHIRAVRSNGEVRTVDAPFGNYSLPVSPGNWTITASREGYTLTNALLNQSITAGSTVSLPDMTMTLNTINISGSVETSSGQTLSHTTVTLHRGGALIATRSTNNNGQYTFSGVGEGEVTLTFSRAGYSPPAPIVRVVTASVVLPPAVMIPRANIVSGSVSNGTTGIESAVVVATPISGASFQTTTNVYGQYTLNLPQGNYTVSVSHPGFTALGSQNISLNVGQTLNEVNLLMQQNASFITGTIMSAGNAPIPDVIVSTGSSSVSTNSLGIYTLPVTAGTYHLTASRSGFVTASITGVSVGTAQSVTTNFVLVANPAMVSGQVTLNGAPVPGATVTGHRVLLTTTVPIPPVTTSADGSYTLLLPTGDFQITAEKSGILFATVSVSGVTVGSVYPGVNINGVLNQGTLMGSVRNNQNMPISNVDIHIRDIHNPATIYNTVTDIHGNYQIPVVASRTYRITATRAGFSNDTVTISAPLSVGATVTSAHTLIEQSASISGNVKDQHNRNILDATILATRETETGIETSVRNTNPMGNYTLPLSFGRWHITVSKLGHTQQDTTVTLHHGSSLDAINFILHTNYASLSGNVRNATVPSENLSGVRVVATNAIGIGSVTQTNPAGNYSFSELVPGTYTITYSREGFGSVTHTQVMNPNHTYTQNISMTPLRANVLVNVNHTDVNLVIENQFTGETSTRIITNAGNTTIHNLPAFAPLRFEFSKQGFVTQMVMVPELQPLQTYHLPAPIVMEQSLGRISGVVTNADVGFIRAAQVHITSSGISRVMTTNLSGVFDFMHLPYGIYTIRATHPEYFSAPYTITLSLDENPQATSETIDMIENDIIISGVVRDQHGTPVANVPISAVSGVSVIRASSSSSGAFTIVGLSPSTIYQISTSSILPGHTNVTRLLDTADLDTPSSAIPDLVMTLSMSSVSGRATNSVTTHGIMSARIDITHTQSGTRYTTDTISNGTFIISHIRDGAYSIAVSREGFVTQTGAFTVEFGAMASNQNFSLTPEGTISVSGMVIRDGDSAVSVPNAPVRIDIGANIRHAVTNESGQFTFLDIPSNTSNMFLSTTLPTDRYDNESRTISTSATDMTNQRLSIRIKTATISGIIYDNAQEPQSGAMVRLRQSGATISTTHTTTDGQYSFSALYAGNYEIQVVKQTFITHHSSIVISDYQSLTHDITLESISDMVAGSVSNAESMPLANVVFLLRDDELNVYTVTSDIDGLFSFDMATAGVSYQLTATKQGYLSYTHPDSVDITDSNLSIVLTATPNAIVGTVRLNNVPKSATIRAMDAQNRVSTVTSNQYGEYIIPNLTGSQRIWAEYTESMTNYVTHWISVNIITGTSAIVDLDLIHSAEITGRVTMAGAGVPFATINAQNQAGNVFSTTSSLDGTYILSGFTGGSYIVYGALTGYIFEQIFSVDLAPGQIYEDMDFTVSLTGNSISGVAVNSQTSHSISDVEVRLYNVPGMALVESTMTSSAGTFSFQNVVSGNYTLRVYHPGFESVADISVISLPFTTEIFMTPRENVIFGRVTDILSDPIVGATIRVSPTSIGIADSTTTTATGMYHISMATAGSYQVTAIQPLYIDSEPVPVTLDGNFAEVNFTLFSLPASIAGTILIEDEGEMMAPDTMTLILSIAGGLPSSITVTEDSSYLFANIAIPPNVTAGRLEINATYSGVSFYVVKNNVPLIPGTMSIQDHVFHFVAGAKNVMGHISMNESGVHHPVTVARVDLLRMNYSIYDSISVASDTGYFQFNSVSPGEYMLRVEATYQFETFTQTFDRFWVSDTDVVLNPVIDFTLSKINVYLYDDIGEPISSNRIIITSHTQSPPVFIELFTDVHGVAMTENTLRGGVYNIMIEQMEINGMRWITPSNLTAVIDRIDVIELPISLPLKYDNSPPIPYGYGEFIDIVLHKSVDFDGDVRLIYTGTTGFRDSFDMSTTSDPTVLSGRIPPQNSSGNVSFYFRTEYNGLVYTNETNPFTMPIAAVGIISFDHSRISHENARLGFRQEFTFEVLVHDELQNDLNDEVERAGIVQWALSNENGSLVVDPDNPRRVRYFSPTDSDEVLTTRLSSRVTLGEHTLTRLANITVRDMYLVALDIAGEHEVDNTSPTFTEFPVSARSNLDTEMTVEYRWEAIDPLKGTIVPTFSGVRYIPNRNFAGKLDLVVSAIDQQHQSSVVGKKTIDVYRMIYPHNPPDVLHTDRECSLVLPGNMLSSGSAKLYINSVPVPPVQQFAIDTEVMSLVYDVRVQGNPIFSQMPDISFLIDEIEDDMEISWWDIDFLTWKPIFLRNPNLMRATLVGWHHYTVIKKSLPLGLYDLKLLPNPFSPFDQIGQNRGLQISFKASTDISRYPKITCKVYNLQGTLVRTIAENKPILKSRYDIGEMDTLYWDGLTNDGRMARNGRYLVHLIIEDAMDKKEYLRAVVLIK
jgi:hypothetical protein